MKHIENRYLLIPAVILFFCSIFSLSALAQQKLPEIIKKIEPATVVILAYNEGGQVISQGSGFFISKNGDIITNKHVLAEANRAEAKTITGKVYPIMMIVAEDKEADIIRASVSVPEESVHTLPVSSSIPEVGERVAVIGSPLGLEQTVSDGIVSAVREIPAFGKIYQITAPISPGSSGSPVVNMKGEVIGVATFQFVEGQNLNFALPSDRIAKLKPEKGKTLNEWEIGKSERRFSSAEGLYNSGLISLWKDDYEKALDYFEKVVKKDPCHAVAYFQIGYCNSKLDRNVEAIEACKQAIRIKPDLTEAHYNLGWFYLNQKHYTEAIESFKQAIRIKPDWAEAHCNLGIAYGKQGHYTEAIEAFKQTIRINPDLVEAHYNMGWAYGKQGHYTEEIEAYKQAIRIKPEHAEAHYYLGIAFGIHQGRLSEAIESFKQAIRIKPDWADAHYKLGATCSVIGDKGSALDQYKILKNLDKYLADRLFNLIYE